MFADIEFEGSKGFICDFITHLYCRIYTPCSEIIQYGDKFPELYLIYKGSVSVQMNTVGKNNTLVKLPQYSYFGDYQILFGMKSQFNYRSNEHHHTYTMCLKKSKFKEILEDY